MATRLDCDPTKVAYEDVDGEIIAINFVTGTYFSLVGTAADIWRHLLAGVGVDAVASAAGGAADAVRAFVAQLLGEGLLQFGSDPASDAPFILENFQAPVLEKFEDMAEMIRLDPIHEVHEAGWPHLPTAA